jgi:hypothetical protein
MLGFAPGHGLKTLPRSKASEINGNTAVEAPRTRWCVQPPVRIMATVVSWALLPQVGLLHTGHLYVKEREMKYAIYVTSSQPIRWR